MLLPVVGLCLRIVGFYCILPCMSIELKMMLNLLCLSGAIGGRTTLVRWSDLAMQQLMVM